MDNDEPDIAPFKAGMSCGEESLGGYLIGKGAVEGVCHHDATLLGASNTGLTFSLNPCLVVSV
jgi:hypothetical protein